MSYTIREWLVDSSKYKLKCPYDMSPIGICVHNTYSDASANNEITYMRRNDNATGYHVAVDDKEAIIGIPFNRNAFHAGDGATGNGNRKYIGIEICYSKSGGQRYKDAEENAVQYIAKLLKERQWGIERVKKHQDFSGKYCPHRILDEKRWDSFLQRIEKAMKGETKEEQDVEFSSNTLKEMFEKRVISKATSELLDKAAVKHLGMTSKLKNGRLTDGDLAAIATELAVLYAKQNK